MRCIVILPKLWNIKHFCVEKFKVNAIKSLYIGISRTKTKSWEINFWEAAKIANLKYFERVFK